MQIKQKKKHRTKFYYPKCEQSQKMLDLINRGRGYKRLTFTSDDLEDLKSLGVDIIIDKKGKQ